MPEFNSGLLEFLKTLFKSLNAPILIFAIGLIIIVGIFGANIPSEYSNLIYGVSIGAMVVHLLTTVGPLAQKSRVENGSPSALDTQTSDFVAGAILYVNVQGFSLLNYQEQEQMVQSLHTEIQTFFSLEDNPTSLSSNEYQLSFWGSDFILFVNANNQSQRPNHELLIECLAFAIHLHRQTQTIHAKLDITLHWGNDLHQLNIGGNLFLYGNDLHNARRMIFFTEGSRLLLSREAFEKIKDNVLVNSITGSCSELSLSVKNLIQQDNNRNIRILNVFTNMSAIDSGSEYFFEPITVYDQHKRKIDLYNFFVQDSVGRAIVGNQSVPPDRVTIEFPENPKNDTLKSSFFKRLVESDEITLIDVTHYQLVEMLSKALEQRENFWKSIEIVFANKDTVQRLIELTDSREQRIVKWEAAKRDVQIFFESKGPDYIDHWKCLETDKELTLTGARFLKGEQASIQVAPILPGNDLSSTAIFEIFKGLRAYEQLSRSFDIIRAGSKSIVEWDLFGKVEEDGFKYHGIVNRVHIGSSDSDIEFCYPVVLIMLYTETIEGLKSVIQERTVYNATSDIGTYSNISGRLSINDAVKNGQSLPFIDFDTETFIATKTFNNYIGWTSGADLPDSVWRNAAIRELKEELGLDIIESRLEDRAEYLLQRKRVSLFFRLFSLNLTRSAENNELELVKQQRPYASLRAYRLSELRELHRKKQLNRLLQNRFYELFVPTFNQIGIVD